MILNYFSFRYKEIPTSCRICIFRYKDSDTRLIIVMQQRKESDK